MQLGDGIAAWFDRLTMSGCAPRNSGFAPASGMLLLTAAGVQRMLGA